MNKPLFLTAIAGLLISGYLFVTYVSPVPLLCGADGGCHTVQVSPYAYLFGLPTPLYGMIYYTTLGILASLVAKNQHQPLLRFALLFSTGVGLAISAWLTYLEAFVVEAWCAWCVASAIMATIAFLLVWMQPKKQTVNNSIV